MKKYNITVNGTTYEVIVEEVGASSSSPAAPVYSTPAPTATAPASKAVKTMAGGSNKVSSPMPGTILDVKVSLGQSVKKGEVVCVLEAMKMENDIPAPCDGVIASINVQKGSSVAANDILLTIN
jgi:biotin carboxyl carrier protein